MTERETELDHLSALEAKRAQRRADRDKAAKAQEAIDLEAIIELEDEYGELATVRVPFNPKNPLPVLCAVRCPNRVELKCFRDSVRPRKRSQGDGPGASDTTRQVQAAEALATSCLVYPDKETHAKLREARPGLHAQLGAEAIQLSVGEAESEGKD